MSLWLALPFDIVLHAHHLTIEYGIGELPYPVAENHEATRAGEHEVKLYVAMSEEEIIHVRMRLEVVLGIDDEMLLVFAHVRRFLAVLALQA